MKLIVDANILVGELLRLRGRALIAHPTLELLISQKVAEEADHELQKRIRVMVRQNRFSAEHGEQFFAVAQDLLESSIQIVSYAAYGNVESEARRRIPRDPDDWHTVALALLTDAAIWTQDCDFLGCGCPTWTTETLLLQLQSA